MKQEYREAFSEVYEIFKLMPQTLLEKIPNKFKEMIKNEKDENYLPNIKEPIENEKLKDETIIILGLIYRDFLCSSEERKRLQEKDVIELNKIEKEIQQQLNDKYDMERIFKDKNKDKIEGKERETSIMVITEKKWYEKIFELIKNIFKKK